MQGTFLRLLGATVVVWASGTTARHDVHIRDPSDATGGPVIKLGYATYEGYYDDTYDLNIWKGCVDCHTIYKPISMTSQSC